MMLAWILAAISYVHYWFYVWHNTMHTFRPTIDAPRIAIVITLVNFTDETSEAVVTIPSDTTALAPYARPSLHSSDQIDLRLVLLAITAVMAALCLAWVFSPRTASAKQSQENTGARAGDSASENSTIGPEIHADSPHEDVPASTPSADAAAQEEIKRLETKVKSLTAANAADQEKYKWLDTDLKLLSASYMQLAQKEEDLKLSQDDAATKNEQLTNDLIAEQKKSCELEQSMELTRQSKGEVAAVNGELTNDPDAELTKDLDAARKERDDLERRVKCVIRSNKTLTAWQKQLIGDFNTEQKKCGELERELQRMTPSEGEATGDINQLASDLDAAWEKGGKLEEEAKRMTQSQNDATAKIERLTGKINAEQKRRREREQKVKRRLRSNEQAMAEIRKLTSTLRIEQQTRSKLEQELERMTQSEGEAKAKVEKLTGDLNAERQKVDEHTKADEARITISQPSEPGQMPLDSMSASHDHGNGGMPTYFPSANDMTIDPLLLSGGSPSFPFGPISQPSEPDHMPLDSMAAYHDHGNGGMATDVLGADDTTIDPLLLSGGHPSFPFGTISQPSGPGHMQLDSMAASHDHENGGMSALTIDPALLGKGFSSFPFDDYGEASQTDALGTN